MQDKAKSLILVYTFENVESLSNESITVKQP